MTPFRDSTVDLRCIGGRYPHALARYCPANIRASLRRRGNTVVLRIDDESNQDRWEEFSIAVDELARLVCGEDRESPDPLSNIPFIQEF